MLCRRTFLRLGPPIAVGLLAACQSLPASHSEPAPTPTSAAQPTAPATAPQRPTATPLPAGDPVSLGPVKDQVVLVDQVGYPAAYRKTGLVADASATTFQLVDTQTSRSVYAAPLGAPQRDPDTGQSLRPADFSSVAGPGSYSLVVPGVGRSPEFRIADDVYQGLYTDSLTSYEQLATLAPQAWQTASAAERQTGQTMDVTGGWPDAGDYGRYVPSAASALGTLLLLADLFPERAPGELRVVRRELDWMLKMQRPDGAVYHKVTPLKFGGFDKGSDNIGGPLYVFDISTPDAGVFAAIMAEAARVYRPTDSGYADRLLAAAESAWHWLDTIPRPILPTELEGTGAYLYGGDDTQRLWAAAELFKTTGQPAYADAVRAYVAKHSPSIGLLGWPKTDTYALLSLAFNDSAEPGLRQQIAQQLTRWADSMATTIDTPIIPWAVSLSSFHWASNKTTLDNAVLLLVANRVAPNTRYVEAALDQLHYVLGRNALARSYVTGYGANSVKNPHNRTMFALGKLVPGVLVGGPNGDAQDGITPPAQGQRSYVDQLMAYACNENSIEYNAPLVFVAALLGGGQAG